MQLGDSVGSYEKINKKRSISLEDCSVFYKFPNLHIITAVILILDNTSITQLNEFKSNHDN